MVDMRLGDRRAVGVGGADVTAVALCGFGVFVLKSSRLNWIIRTSRRKLKLELELSHFNGQFFHQVENVLTCLFEL